MVAVDGDLRSESMAARGEKTMARHCSDSMAGSMVADGFKSVSKCKSPVMAPCDLSSCREISCGEKCLR